MSPHNSKNDSDEIEPEYDFANGVRGKYFQRYRAGTNIILLEPDLLEAFPDSTSVNQALRMLVRLSKTKGPTNSRPNKALQPASRARRKGKSKSRSRAARG